MKNDMAIRRIDYRYTIFENTIIFHVISDNAPYMWLIDSIYIEYVINWYAQIKSYTFVIILYLDTFFWH